MSCTRRNPYSITIARVTRVTCLYKLLSFCRKDRRSAEGGHTAAFDLWPMPEDVLMLQNGVAVGYRCVIDLVRALKIGPEPVWAPTQGICRNNLRTWIIDVLMISQSH